jgi:hypothetical protein
MSNHSIYGHLVLSNGSISSEQNMIEICKKVNEQDYNTITDVINEIN